jgi:membrane protease subunit HflC
MFFIVVAAVAVIVAMCAFTVDERDHVLKFKFGEIVRSDYEPGLHFKLPLVETVRRYPDRILRYENSSEKFLTGEKKNLIVDYFVTWRITDPAEYYRSTRGDEERAVERLAAIVKEGIKAAISRRTVQQVVSADRAELMEDMLLKAQERAPELGIQIVDVRVKRIDLSDEVSDSVYMRMRQERDRVAAQLRAEGREEEERIRANADKQYTIILSEANRDSERIRGAGDARAAEVYAQAYGQNADFYEFYRSMQAYRAAIGGEKDMLVLKPDSDFFKFLQGRVRAPVE